jgi:hypothetical protein
MVTIPFGNVEIRDPSNRAMAIAYRSFRAGSGVQTMAATTETPILLLTNPSTNVVPLSIFMRKILALTAGHTAIFRFYVNPTVSANGTATTPLNLRVNANSPAAKALVYKLPTVSANGTIQGAWNASNVDTVLNEPLILDVNNSLLVTVQAQATSDMVDAQIDWSET